jgi:hypothetical protein
LLRGVRTNADQLFNFRRKLDGWVISPRFPLRDSALAYTKRFSGGGLRQFSAPARLAKPPRE